MPDGTVTVIGTDAATDELFSFTERPEDGAAELIERVPVTDVPPTTLTGFSARDAKLGATT